MPTTEKVLVFVGGGEGYVELDVPVGSGGSGGTQYAYVLDASQPTGGNVYASWAALYAALSLVPGPALVQYAPESHITAGSYVLDNVIFEPAQGGTTLHIDAGVTIAPGTISFASGAIVHADGTSGSVMHAVSGGQTAVVIVSDASSLVSTAGEPFLLVDESATAVVIARDAATIGDGTNAVVSSSGATTAYGLGGSTIAAGALSGVITRRYDASTAVGGSEAASSLIDQAYRVAYTPTTPANWTVYGGAPATTQAALDALAAYPGPQTQSTTVGKALTAGAAAVSLTPAAITFPNVLAGQKIVIMASGIAVNTSPTTAAVLSLEGTLDGVLVGLAVSPVGIPVSGASGVNWSVIVETGALTAGSHTVDLFGSCSIENVNVQSGTVVAMLVSA